MERRQLFKRKRRSGDLAPPEGTESERISPPSEDEPGDGESPELEEASVASASEEPAPEGTSEEPPEESDQAEAKRPRRFRRGKKERAPRVPVANLSVVRRERRALMREREERIRDLGGLMLEMYRRDQFREDLIVERCAQAMSVENRIHELDSILTRAKAGRLRTGPQCACGAPLLFGARFCANCGRPTDLAATGELCARCLQPLPLGAAFCSSCGATIREDEVVAERNEGIEQTIEEAPHADAESGLSGSGEP
jgi:hypothetical protein